MLFSVNLRNKSENLNKIWKFENPRWRPPVTSFIWLLLPWKPIRHHVVSLNWKYKWSLLYVPNFKSIGWIVSKLDGGADWPPPPSRLRVTIFSGRLLGLICKKKSVLTACINMSDIPLLSAFVIIVNRYHGEKGSDLTDATASTFPTCSISI